MKKSKMIICTIIAVLVIGCITIIYNLDNVSGASPSPLDLKKAKIEREEQKLQRAREEIKANNIKKPEGNPGPEYHVKDAPIKTEIIDFVDDPLIKKIINFTNGWITEANDEDIWASAGAYTKDTEQGVVLIRRFNAKGRGIKSSSIIETPEKVGAVKITGYEGLILTLTSENGDVFKFDVASEKFVD